MKDKAFFLPFRADGLWGYMDETGKTTIPPTFPHACFFREGLAAVKLHGKYGYIREDGTMAIEPRFDEAGEFFMGSAIVHYDGGYALIDKMGNEIHGQKFDLLYNIDESGRLFAAQRPEENTLGIVDYGGNTVLPFDNDDIDGFDECGWLKVSQGGRHTFMDTGLKAIRSFAFEEMSGFHDNMSIVGHDGRTGVLNRCGEMVLPIEFHGCQFCNANRIGVRLSDDGDYSFYYPHRHEWGNLQFDYCLDASMDGMMFIERDGRWSLYGNDERIIAEDVAKDFLGCPYDNVHKILTMQDEIEYISIVNRGLHFIRHMQ